MPTKGNNGTVSGWIIDNKGHREFPPLNRRYIFEEFFGIFPFCFIPMGNYTLHGLCDPVKDTFNIGDKPFAGRTRIDPDPEFRYHDNSLHAPDNTDIDIIRSLNAELLPPGCLGGEYLGIDIAVPAFATKGRIIIISEK